MMCRYSIIIPVYNSAKYLEPCVYSVLKQDTESKYEVILVDDGSTDGSEVICEKLSQMHECIVMVHQNNQGVSSARNHGINLARGEYILFLDADDMWNPKLLSELDRISRDQPDIIHFGFQEFLNNEMGRMILQPPVQLEETGEMYLDRLLSSSVLPIASSCTSAYRRTFLIRNSLYFPLGIRYAEDLLFRVRCLKKAKVLKDILKPLYQYRVYGESTSHTLTAEKVSDLLSVCIDIYREFPCEVLAEYYCLKILNLADLQNEEAKIIYPILNKNRDILVGAKSKKATIARLILFLFGWHCGAKIIKIALRMKNREYII